MPPISASDCDRDSRQVAGVVNLPSNTMVVNAMASSATPLASAGPPTSSSSSTSSRSSAASAVSYCGAGDGGEGGGGAWPNAAAATAVARQANLGPLLFDCAICAVLGEFWVANL
ncbi:unnamed protein product [Anisakis simplex]|uniref:Uncharacterized protein n=1 Tax=Anisakis simplex TaxID=6269 RepID=A0A0M3J990_ANISI|nr:unnamed protein product [Anisakis simplex]